MIRKSISFATALILSVAFISCSDSGTAKTTTGDSSKVMDNTSTSNADSMTNNTTATPAEQGVMVGGAMMVPSKNIVENAAGSSDHTTLVAAVKAAGLDGTLSGAGPFTVFA